MARTCLRVAISRTRMRALRTSRPRRQQRIASALPSPTRRCASEVGSFAPFSPFWASEPSRKSHYVELRHCLCGHRAGVLRARFRLAHQYGVRLLPQRIGELLLAQPKVGVAGLFYLVYVA